MNDYQISIKRLHHSECILEYKDSLGELSIWVDQSPFEEYDYVSTEERIEVRGERFDQVLKNIQEWAQKEDYIIKIWKENEIGI